MSYGAMVPSMTVLAELDPVGLARAWLARAGPCCWGGACGLVCI